MKARLLWPLSLLLLASGAFALCASQPAEQSAERRIRTVTIRVPDRNPEFYCWEPHIAVDPENPERVLLGAIFGGQVGKGDQVRADTRLLAWRSEDGGQSWSEPIEPFGHTGRPAGRIGADPVVAFSTDKTCWFAGLDYDFPVPKPGYHSLNVCRWDGDARRWNPSIKAAELDNDKRGKGVIDKPWLAVDQGTGKRRGTVYVAWTRLDFDNRRAELWCASLSPDGRQFSAAVRLGDPIDFKAGAHLIHHVQLAVRPDGTLDAVWRMAPSIRLVHAWSQDGGETFSKPAAISDNEENGKGQFPSLAAVPDGSLFVSWASQGDVFCSSWAVGRWSAPCPLDSSLPERVRLSHPAAAAVQDVLWILAYRWDKKPERVSVVLYRSTDQGKKWKEYCTLATRESPDGKARQFSPGDYVSVAAAKGRIYATYVLPGEAHEGPGPRLYVSTLDARESQ